MFLKIFFQVKTVCSSLADLLLGFISSLLTLKTVSSQRRLGKPRFGQRVRRNMAQVTRKMWPDHRRQGCSIRALSGSNFMWHLWCTTTVTWCWVNAKGARAQGSLARNYSHGAKVSLRLYILLAGWRAAPLAARMKDSISRAGKAALPGC